MKPTISEMLPQFVPSSRDDNGLLFKKHLDLQELVTRADKQQIELPRELETRLLMLHARYTPHEARQRVLNDLMDHLQSVLGAKPEPSDEASELAKKLRAIWNNADLVSGVNSNGWVEVANFVLNHVVKK